MRSHLKHFAMCTNWLLVPTLRIFVLYSIVSKIHRTLCSNCYLGDKSRLFIVVLLAFPLLQVSCHSDFILIERKTLDCVLADWLD